MEDLIFTTLVLIFALVIHLWILRRTPDRLEQRRLSMSFVAHLSASWGLLLVYVYYYQIGDMLSYHRQALPLTNALRYDPWLFAPELFKALFHLPSHLPAEVAGVGSTGSMQAFAVFLLFPLGDSFVAAATLIGVGAYVSKWCLVRAFGGGYSGGDREAMLTALLLSPSGVVWSCGLLKEPLVMIFMGPFLLGLKGLIDGRKLTRSVVLIAGATVGMALLKPYIVACLVLAATAWIIWARVIQPGGLLVKPVYLVVAALVAILGLTATAQAFPQLSFENVGESMARQRRYASKDEGGSNFYLEAQDTDVDAAENKSLTGQVALIPIALVTALFRPFIFEARKAMQLLNALEMTWLLALFASAWRRNGATGTARRILADPVLMFSVVFTVTLAVGTGLSTANLGTLSRYRAPMMPFFLLLLLVLRRPETKGAAVAAREPPPLDHRVSLSR